jgi:hypothetical protein
VRLEVRVRGEERLKESEGGGEERGREKEGERKGKGIRNNKRIE